ncbi:hypothetical protein HCA99_16380 [Listeria booriae]|uniref:helix-hairpin-helix domain-containing protein n=1 Tax=Listeria booriae TaxID=1552123 RepID=UPI001627970E|nr:helix-hairpin-helix domain-containing protein [Listeria booriae]MBC2080810.1 hypothetical protein [Listeria booriae]
MKKLLITIAFIFMIGAPLTVQSNDANAATQSSIATGESSIDINTATKEQLETITGIGGVLSQRIIENRPYKTLDDLLKVKGIGEKILQKIKEQNIAFVIDLDANVISDSSLQKAINRTLNQSDSTPVTKASLVNLTSLSNTVLTASDEKIKSLEGLEFAVNLKILKLENQEIADLSPLQSISALEQLNLKNNSISDVSPLYRDSGFDLETDTHRLLTSINLANNKIEDLDISLLQHAGPESRSNCYINLDNNYIGSDCSILVGTVSALHQRSFNHFVFDLSTFPPTQNSIELQGIYSGQSYSILPYLEGEPNGRVALFDRRDSFDESTNIITSTDLRNREEIVYEVYTSYVSYSSFYNYSYIVTILLR